MFLQKATTWTLLDWIGEIWSKNQQSMKEKKIKREESKFINYFETNVATGNIVQ